MDYLFVFDPISEPFASGGLFAMALDNLITFVDWLVLKLALIKISYEKIVSIIFCLFCANFL